MMSQKNVHQNGSHNGRRFMSPEDVFSIPALLSKKLREKHSRKTEHRLVSGFKQYRVIFKLYLDVGEADKK